MCGIAGLMNPQLDEQKATDRARSMIDQLQHRGPDDAGIWACKGLALAQSRLAIIDISDAGHQPMTSENDRYVIVFNGEIYNHLSLRQELDQRGLSPNWRGHSDTETLLAILSAYDTQTALSKCIGMFAFALWDKKHRTLTLARDRMGEKPLYYGWQGNSFFFGSELKALRIDPDFKGGIDRQALQAFIQLAYIPAPRSIYENIKKMMPGSFVVIPQDLTPGTLPEPETYWSLQEVVSQEVNTGISDQDALTELEGLLNSAVSQQMIADVPLGAFLSGGFDSSLISAVMQANSSTPIKTFTIGFNEKQYNEAEHAKSIASYLKTDHTELYIDSSQALNLVPDLPHLYDEPFADSSQIPTYLVSKLARNHVTVSLSGDGGDELFGGYNRYLWAKRLWRAMGRLPSFGRKAGAGAIHAFSPQMWDSAFHLARPITPGSLRFKTPGDKLHKLADLLSAQHPQELYNRLISQWPPSADIVLGAERTPLPNISDDTLASFEAQMMYMDQTGYLPGDILTKVDRAAMGVSLETRIPLLDHRVVEFSWRMPLDKKIRNGRGKWLLRELLYKHVPQDLVDRPKMGFGVPIDAWLRGPLKDWAQALLDPSRLAAEGFLDAHAIELCWQEHLSGRRNWSYRLWNVLMFQAWLEAQKK